MNTDYTIIIPNNVSNFSSRTTTPEPHVPDTKPRPRPRSTVSIVSPQEEAPATIPINNLHQPGMCNIPANNQPAAAAIAAPLIIHQPQQIPPALRTQNLPASEVLCDIQRMITKINQQLGYVMKEAMIKEGYIMKPRR